MKAGIFTLGCKVNTYESLFVSEKLKEAGYVISEFEDVCDVYIINTCTVTNASDVKSKKMIRNAIRRNPDACIVAMGCFIEANKDYREQGLDIVIGNQDKSEIVNIIDDYFKEKKQIKRVYEKMSDDFEDMRINEFPGRVRAFVKIQDGCENFCSYCIIPFVRGKCRSKKEEEVINEIVSLVKNGYQEIVLTGIHTGNYGIDLDTNFATLLKEIVKVDGLKRLRISSIEITELTDEVIDIIKHNDIIVDHLHIPLQSGSDEILKLMNRKYKVDYFEQKLKVIRSIRPDISITTDVIVGHPGESDELFMETLNSCRRLEFTKIHVFPYSSREGTPSADMTQIDGKIRKERARELLLVSKELQNKYEQKFIGKDMEVLIEQEKEGISFGHTSNFIHVKINKELKPNTLKRVKIKEVEFPYCIGE